MSLMIAAALALTAQTAECALEYDTDERRGGYPAAIRAICPDNVADAEALQRAADAAVAAIRLDPPREGTRRNPAPAFELAPSARFGIAGDGAWDAEPGQEIIMSGAVFPIRAAERGADLSYCAIGFTPDDAGQPRHVEIGCLINTPGSMFIRSMERSMGEAVDRWRMLPSRQAYCYSTEVVTTARIYQVRHAQSGQPETSLRDAGPGLDPDDLPRFCAQAG
jgi:hypothetical protein